MTDDLTTTDFGLGAIQSPPDVRDLTFADLLVETEEEVALAPASFLLTGLPPVLNQGSTPMCVAFSSAGLKAFEDKIDQKQFFDFDKPTFFRLIGGGPNGAVVRVALEQLLKVGYPVVATGQAILHRIRAYYGIARTQAELKQAIYKFGPLVLSTPWFHSWFHPIGPAGARYLPAPDYRVGGHAILAIGYNAVGLVLRNSWGSAWGDKGNVIMPWAYVTQSVWEAWKALDEIVVPPTGKMHVAGGSYRTYTVVAGRAKVMTRRLVTDGLTAAYEIVKATQADGVGTTTLVRIADGKAPPAGYKGLLLYRYAKGIVLQS